MRHSQLLIGSGCLIALVSGTVPILAQQASAPEDGGPLLTFGLRSTLSATDNYDLEPDTAESVALFDNRLSFGYRDRRANDVFSLDASGVLRADEPPGGSNTFDDRRVRVGYERQGGNSALSFGADYSLAAVQGGALNEDGFFEDEPLEEADFIEDRGDREQISARFSFETGRNSRIGVVTQGRYQKRTYTGSTDPGLFDTERFNLSGTTRFTLSSVTEARVVLRYEDYSAEDTPRTDRRTVSVNLGFTQALSPVDTLEGALGFQEIETEETIAGARRTETDTGTIGKLAFERELERGTIGTSFDLRESVNGTTATWRVSRAMPLPRGTFEVALGATSDVSDTLHPVGRVGLTREMKSGTLAASIERQVSTSSRSNELRTTRASLGYSYRVNSVSDLELSATAAELARAGGPAVNDTLRADLGATYSRDLTRDWQLSTGYEYRLRDEAGAGRATSNRVFLTLEWELGLRP